MKLSANPRVILEPISKKWANRQQFMEQVGQELVNSTKRRIETTKQDPDGQPWSPWALATKRAREKDGTSGKGLLNRTGRLLESITYQVQGNNLAIGTEVPYSVFLQMGTSKMPARRFIGFGAQDEQTIRRIWTEWLNNDS